MINRKVCVCVSNRICWVVEDYWLVSLSMCVSSQSKNRNHPRWFQLREFNPRNGLSTEAVTARSELRVGRKRMMLLEFRSWKEDSAELGFR